MENCIVCWENNVETSHRILTTSKEWQENVMQNVIEKHLNWWQLRELPNKDNVPWICRSCWLEISSFHSFYVRVENVHKQFASTSQHKPPETVVVPKKIIPKLKRKRGRPRKESRGNVEELCIVNVKSEVKDFFEISPLEPSPAKELHNFNGECSDFILPDPLQQTKAIEKNNIEEYDDSLEEANSTIIEELNIVDIKHEQVSDAKQFDIAMEPMRHQLDYCDDDNDKGSDPECSPTNDSAGYYYGTEFHKDIKSYLDYQQKREGVKNLNIINDEFIAANHKIFCDLCNERMEDFKTLLTHFKTEHNVPGYVKCCGKKWYKQPHLVDHIHLHKNPQFFKCPDCEKCYSTRYYFLFHVGEHRKGPARIFACDICDVKLVSKAHLKNHKRRKHEEENLKEHICPICSRVSASLMIHKDHIKVAHCTERKHKCHICPKAFKYPKLLREHVGSHTKTALYSCPFCPKTFIRNGDFYKHKKHQHPEEWKEERLKRLSNKEDNTGKKKILNLDLNNYA